MDHEGLSRPWPLFRRQWPDQLISGAATAPILQWNLEDSQVIRKMKHGVPGAAVSVSNAATIGSAD